MYKKLKHYWRKNLPVSEKISEETAPTRKNYPLCVEIIGAPDDRGISNVGGRVGANHGPHHLREALGNMLIGIKPWEESVCFNIGSDIELGHCIENGHNNLRSKVSHLISESIIPIVIGGGHDYGYPHIAGISDAFPKKVGLINVDAHLDLRPPNHLGITSGSPFYLAIENNTVSPKLFYEFGIQNHCNDRSLFEYAKQKEVNLVFLDDTRQSPGPAFHFESILKNLTKKKLKIVVSFDIDSILMSAAPGTSAPQADGFSVEEFFKMVELCATYSSVASIGFFELSPPLDENQKTTKLVATAIHRFVSFLPNRLVKNTSGKTNSIKQRLLGR